MNSGSPPSCGATFSQRSVASPSEMGWLASKVSIDTYLFYAYGVHRCLGTEAAHVPAASAVIGVSSNLDARRYTATRPRDYRQLSASRRRSDVIDTRRSRDRKQIDAAFSSRCATIRSLRRSVRYGFLSSPAHD